MAGSGLFESFLDQPVFALTSDQDWAPDWALESLLGVTVEQGLPLHVFVTNASPALESERADLTLGIHPNFQPGSSHGEGADDVIRACLDLVPAASTFRTHGYFENTAVLRKLVAQGLRADSNLLTFLQPGLRPLLHGTGLLRFPVVFEDDVFLEWAGPDLSLAQASELLLTPGLKVLNFHPALVGLNAPSVEYYDRMRPALRSGSPVAAYEGRGAKTILLELIHEVTTDGFRFISFPSLVDQALTSVEEFLPGGLYGWGSGSTWRHDSL